MYSTAEESNSRQLRSPADPSSHPRTTSPTAAAHPAHFGHAEQRGRTRHRHIDVESTEQRQEKYSQNVDHRSRTRVEPSSPTSSSFLQHTHHQQQHREHLLQSTDMSSFNHGNPMAAIPPSAQPKMPPILPPPGSVPGSGSGFVSGIEAAAASALTLANNIAFRPMTTQPAKCSKLKIRIFFDSTIFQAGGNLFGRMEITATSTRSLKLGEIAVELAAYEEITSKDFTATQSFLSSRLCFQGPNIPPSNAVHGPCDEDGFWMAKKGKTTFPFAFQLPLDCPSSLVFGQTASLRYVVTGLVQVFYHNKDEMILKTKEAFVVEAWDGYNPDYRLPVQASNSTKLFWGGSGSLVLEAMLSEKLHSAGGNLSVEVKVSNNTNRKVQGIRLGVARRLEMVSNKDKAQQDPGLKIDTVSVSETIGTQEFKSSSYLFDTGEERTMTVNMIVPGNARTIRGTALFEVTCFVVVSMLLGTFSGELSVEIPVKICHPASLTPAPKPKLDDNHLPHHYNLVDEDLDLEIDRPTRSNRRIGSNDSLAPPITSGYDHGGNSNPAGHGRDLPWNSEVSERQDEDSNAGRQGEWSQDARELSPANSITSIKSLLASPKQKLSRLADKIQRSTSPSSSSHIQHEHRQGSKFVDDANGQGRRQMAKSPPLGPAMPLAYVPAVERVRYTPFQPPPTTKAKEFLKAAAQYQQEMSFGGALSGLGGDNAEFNLDDKTMASAIHQWISKKESEGMYQSTMNTPSRGRSTSPVQIPIASPNRRRPAVGPIDTQVGSFSSQHSPSGASPQSYDSPTSFGGSDHFLPSPGASSYLNQTTSRFLHHAHRQPAAPQTEAFGSALEDCMAELPLFAKPLPLPSPPQTGSPMRAGIVKPPGHPRSLSPVPIPVQTPESLALAREAFERVKRVASPVQAHMMDAAARGNTAAKSGFIDSPHPSSLELNPTLKAPIPVSAAANFGTSPSGFSRLLGNDSEPVHHPKHARDGHTIESTPPQHTSSPNLTHVPMNRPLPIPAPKPRHLNQSGASPSVDAANFTRDQAARAKPEPAARPVPGATLSGHLRNPQPSSSVISTSPPRNEQPTRSGHLFATRGGEPHTKSGSIQQNAYVPKPTPMPTARPPVPAQQSAALDPKGRSAGTGAQTTGKSFAGQSGAVELSAQAPGGGFVYPKAARKPVPGATPVVAVKPKALTSHADVPRQESARPPRRGPVSATAAIMDSLSHAALDQRLRKHQHEASPNDPHPERQLLPVATTRAPQVVTEQGGRASRSGREEQAGKVIMGFEVRKDIATVVEEDDESEEGGRMAFSFDAVVPQQDSRDRYDHHEREHHRYRHHGQRHESDRVIITETEVQAPEPEQDNQNEIRAQAIAAKNSIRATGVHTGGYVVNTGKLRQVIKDNNSNNSGAGGSGQLIQALADGALNAASAAASGLGWRQQPSSTPSTVPVAATPRKMQPGQTHDQLLSSSPQRRHEHGQGADSRDRVSPVPRGSGHHPSTEQIHDLTMKDIHFQTLSPSDHPQQQQPSAVASPASPTRATFTTTTTTHNQHREYEQTRSHHLVASTSPAHVTTTTQSLESRSLPGSRVIEVQPRQEPLPAVSVAVAVEAIPDSSAIVATTPVPNLDKTLPKIQEQTPRSRVYERPDKKVEVSPKKPMPGLPTPTPPPRSPTNAKPLPRPRYGPGSGAPGETPLTGGSSATPKAINPRLQEYIQKYNLAANTRS